MEMSTVRRDPLTGGVHRSLWQAMPRWLGLLVLLVLTAVVLAETVTALLNTFWSSVSLSGEPRPWTDVVAGTVSLLLAAIAGLAYGVTLAVLFRRRRLLLAGIGLALPLLVGALAVYFFFEAADPHPGTNAFPWNDVAPFVETPLWWLPILAMLIVVGIELGTRRTGQS